MHPRPVAHAGCDRYARSVGLGRMVGSQRRAGKVQATVGVFDGIANLRLAPDTLREIFDAPAWITEKGTRH
jgi:hypothetical protein